MQIWHRLAPLINLHTNKSCWPLLKRRIPSHFNFQQRLVRHPELEPLPAAPYWTENFSVRAIFAGAITEMYTRV
jgi:hypothetical protein